MKSLFDKYKVVKSLLDYDYKGYPIDKIVAVDIISLVYNKKQFSVRELLNIFSTRRIHLPKESEVLYSIGNYKRADYYELLSFVRTDIDSDLLDLSLVDKTFCFSIKNLYQAFRLVFRNDIGLGFLSKLSLLASVTYSMNVIDYLESQSLSKIRIFCSFCSNLTDEAILDFYFQKKKIPTYTLQHGLWFLFDSPPIDVIIYENLVANRLLCWGQYTKDEFVKYGIDESRLIVAGYPKKIKQLVALNLNKRKKRIVILFARVLFDSNNLELISLIANMNKEVDVEFKLHPSLCIEKYKSLAKKYGFKLAPSGTIQDLLSNGEYDYSISYNSTAYYDSYINNCISFRYKDKDADNSIDVLDDSFSSIQEFYEKLALIQEKELNNKLWHEVEKRLNYILGYGVNEYAFSKNDSAGKKIF